MSLRGSLRAWLQGRRLRREAARLLREALAAPEALRGTSLAPRHAARCVIVGTDEDGGRVVRIRFGILRHPRPYAFSRQSHKVLETYLYHVQERRMERLSGRNLTREAGEDAG